MRFCLVLLHFLFRHKKKIKKEKKKANGPFSCLSHQKTISTFCVRVGLFRLALVEHPGDGWYVQLAAVGHWLLLKSCFTSTETVGLIGTGAQDGHLDFHTAPGLGLVVT